jgi:hypothetical protein
MGIIPMIDLNPIHLVTGALGSLGDLASSVGLNPFDWFASAAGSVASDVWTAAMLALWNASMFFYRLIMGLLDTWLTPDLRTSGPGGMVYPICFWLALAMVSIFVMIQLGVAVAKRDGRSLARAFIGTGQFGVAWGSWFGYCVVLIAACGGLTRALLQSLFGAVSFANIQIWKQFDSKTITDATLATVLGLLGIVLVLASIAHLFIYLIRAASLIVLVATSQMSAAGLVADFSKAWFWKSVRWIHAAALSPVLMTLVLGIGAKFTQGAVLGLTDSSQQAVGTAIPGVIIVAGSAVCPFWLFKLLAFVEPGTPSGQAMRTSIAAQGGIKQMAQKALGIKGESAHGGSSAAAHSAPGGGSHGEAAAEAATSGRFASMMGKGGSALTAAKATPIGRVASVVGAGVKGVQAVGRHAVGVEADLNAASGVGTHGGYPDFAGAGNPSGRSSGNGGRQSGGGQGSQPTPQPAQQDAAPVGTVQTAGEYAPAATPVNADGSEDASAATPQPSTSPSTPPIPETPAPGPSQAAQPPTQQPSSLGPQPSGPGPRPAGGAPQSEQPSSGGNRPAAAPEPKPMASPPPEIPPVPPV